MAELWRPGVLLARPWWDAPGHLIMDTGMQLLTHCGLRVTFIGAAPSPEYWIKADRLGCFDCLPSPLIEWTETDHG